MKMNDLMQQNVHQSTFEHLQILSPHQYDVTKIVHSVLVNIKFLFHRILFLFIVDLREYTTDFKDIEDDWKNAENVCKINLYFSQ
jgi:hypothetical protein